MQEVEVKLKTKGDVIQESEDKLNWLLYQHSKTFIPGRTGGWVAEQAGN